MVSLLPSILELAEHAFKLLSHQIVLLKQIIVGLLQLGILHDDVCDLTVFKNDLLLVELCLDFRVSGTEIHQQFLIGCDSLLSQLEEVLLALE